MSLQSVSTRALVVCAALAWPCTGLAQDTAPAASTSLVDRTFTAVNYQHRSGATRIDFQGASLAPGASGEAKVESQRGYLRVEAKLRGLPVARTFGAEYFTYVLWAITPEGRAQNLGEVVLRGDRAELTVTTDLQAFALIVTAEPYFAITTPSDVVILVNAVRDDTKGRLEEVNVHSELIRRGAFTALERPDELTARLMVVDPRVPLEIYQARNAVRIVRWVGAERYAADAFSKAVDFLIEAETYQARRNSATRPAVMMARQAVQAAEDARLLTMQGLAAERLAVERAEAAAREATATALAQSEASRRVEAEEGLRQAEDARRLADLRRAEADAATQRAEQVRLIAEQAAAAAARDKAEAESAAAQAAATLGRARDEFQVQTLQIEAEREAAARARSDAVTELERIRRESSAELARLDAARAEAARKGEEAAADAARARVAADEADQLRARSERERAQLRDQLQAQLNRVMETRNTARGLIVNMADVLFDTGKFTLREAAREKLARMSGILSMQPGLRLVVEGHTDSVGSEEYNFDLSRRRTAAVRDYLITQGIDPGAITAVGFGESRPAADNDTPAGRQQNRRVELVVSGDAIAGQAVPDEGAANP